MSIATAIERNRIALLRIVFCWLGATHLINARSDKPLPRRLSAWILDRIIIAEKAAACLLVALFYSNQIKKRCAPNFENAAGAFIAFNSAFTLGALTTSGIIKRLKSLRHILLNLRVIARHLVNILAARAWIEAMKRAAQNHVFFHIAMICPAATMEDAIPP
ncbi:hypothetical protein [Ahrensia marina]|uniref:Uncharacterized protein n=1 Tax=Ahrensia marina TaxID=1514904 RepID=A0A0N0VLX4_9HYPH|nr:hypothetical protein [Ahrensia marina]KPB01684.1 hypothetical protein SU32_07420 [Ahrensia marina]